MTRKPAWLISTLLIALLLAGVTGVTARQRSPATGGQAPRKPNVVFILGDDLGYCDVSMSGCKEIPTPNIDSIAKNGIRFTKRLAL